MAKKRRRKKKRVGLREAKKTFHKRSLQSQVQDRRHTAKTVMFPGSKNSWKWKKNPNKCDMRFVDTKSQVQRRVIGGDVSTPFGKRKSRSGIKQLKREVLASFSPRVVLSQEISTKKLGKKSSVKARYRKTKKGYQLYISPKRGAKFPVQHPIVSYKSPQRRRTR